VPIAAAHPQLFESPQKRLYESQPMIGGYDLGTIALRLEILP
jgi:hypothetical protein